VTGWIRVGGTYPEQSYSLLSISNPNVLLWALKPADDGVAKGLITRVWNLSPESQSYSLSLAPGIAEAARATHIETDIERLPANGGKVEMRAERSQIQTLRIVPAKITN
jgi:alpha-mannosidase